MKSLVIIDFIVKPEVAITDEPVVVFVDETETLIDKTDIVTRREDRDYLS